jgi:catechol 2,3-dioxygenase-like lactoylglutathione lyase family enzyme
MTIRLEHANISVKDIDGMIRFLQTAFPSFRIRRDETEPDGSRWVHIGTDDAYIALNQATEDSMEDWTPYGGKPGLNHLGFEVDDTEAIRLRLKEAGYRDSTYPNAHPHRRRVYFYDAEGNDWEFVQYLSDIVKERNDYELSDDA